MSFTSNLEINKDFATVIKRKPQIFDEVFLKFSSDNALSEKELLLMKIDLFFTLLLVIMIENGFQPILNDCEPFDPGQVDTLRLSKWKLSSGLYEADFFMSGNSEVSVKLILTPLGTTALVNAVISKLASETYSMCLPIDKHLVFSKQAIEVAQIFYNLQLLSDTFKNKILSPVKSKILSICGYPGPSLIELPEDIFLKIMFYLPITDIVNVAVTSKKCYQYLREDYFWHKLYVRDYQRFGAEASDSLYANWRLSYIISYRRHAKLRTFPVNTRGRFYECQMGMPPIHYMDKFIQ